MVKAGTSVFARLDMESTRHPTKLLNHGTIWASAADISAVSAGNAESNFAPGSIFWNKADGIVKAPFEGFYCGGGGDHPPDVTNDGLISVDTGYADSRQEGDAYGVWVNDFNFHLTNDGNIVVNTSTGTSFGAALDNGGNVTNAGSIHVKSGHKGGFGIKAGDSPLSVQNSGKLLVTDEHGTGTAIAFASGLNLNNQGIIRGDSALMGTTGPSTGEAHIDNSGTIRGLIALSNYDMEIGNTGKIYGNISISGGEFGTEAVISNSGTIHATQTDSPAIAFEGSYGFITNTGAIYGDVQFSTADSMFNGAEGRVFGAVIGSPGKDILNAGKKDSLVGGRGNDSMSGVYHNTFNGGVGADQIVAHGGSSNFIYQAPKDSTSGAHDVIEGFNARSDTFQLPQHVRAISSEIEGGQLRSGPNFDQDLADAVGALHKHCAVLFAPDSGNQAGHIFLIIDANGEAGYQAKQDYVIELVQPKHVADFGMFDFSELQAT